MWLHLKIGCKEVKLSENGNLTVSENSSNESGLLAKDPDAGED